MANSSNDGAVTVDPANNSNDGAVIINTKNNGNGHAAAGHVNRKRATKVKTKTLILTKEILIYFPWVCILHR
jgi:hypothetical protein